MAGGTWQGSPEAKGEKRARLGHERHWDWEGLTLPGHPHKVLNGSQGSVTLGIWVEAREHLAESGEGVGPQIGIWPAAG